MYGWAGTILRVDLTRKKIMKEPLSDDLAYNYIGGTGIGTKILYDEVPPEIGPLDPEARVIICTGPLTGTLAPSSGRYGVVLKAPDSGVYGDTNGGGTFSPELRWAGYDLVVIQGRAEKPVYLWIDDDFIELRDAGHLWGKDTWETQKIIRQELGDPEIKTLKIGAAGENVTNGGCLIADLSRAAGHCAAGSAFGAKKLKAIAVRGTKGNAIAKPQEFEKYVEELIERIQRDPMYDMVSKWGTPWYVTDFMALATKSSDLLAEQGFGKSFKKSTGCFSCPLHCSHWYRVDTGPYAGTYGEGCEGNAVAWFGFWPTAGFTGINDHTFILKCNTLANKLGLHVDFGPTALRWAMILYEKKIITKEDTDGIELTWGNKEAALEMYERMAYRKGFGDILADYPIKAAKKLGRGSEKFAREVKGAYDYFDNAETIGWGGISWLLALHTATRGCDHLKSVAWGATSTWALLRDVLKLGISEEQIKKLSEKEFGLADLLLDTSRVDEMLIPYYAKAVTEAQRVSYLCDMTQTCKFISLMNLFGTGLRAGDYAKLLTLGTGREFTTSDVINAADRVHLLQRAYNAREGLRRLDDYLWEYKYEDYFKEPYPGKLPFPRGYYDKLLDEYYKAVGCDLKTGIPTKEALESLGLKYVIEDLKERKIEM